MSWGCFIEKGPPKKGGTLASPQSPAGGVKKRRPEEFQADFLFGPKEVTMPGEL